MNIFLQIVLTFLITSVLSFFFIKGLSFIFYKYSILDNPKKYKKKRKPIPYGMGIAFFLIFFLVSFFCIYPYLSTELAHKLELIWGFSGLISIVSFLDDRLNISALGRLLTQMGIGFIIGMTSIKIGYISGIFSDTIDLGFFNFDILGYTIYIIPVIFTMLWYVFIFNSLNWSDGITGNTTLLSLVSFIIILFLGIKLYFIDDYIGGVHNAEFIIKICTILVAILCVYFFFDIKEKMLMGDAGTMFLGFMLATIAIISGGKIATVLVVFGLYSIDAIVVAVRRMMKGVNPMKGDFTHLHHRLRDAGLSNNQILTLIATASFGFGFISLFLDKTGKIFLFVCIIVFVLFIEKFIIMAKNKNL